MKKIGQIAMLGVLGWLALSVCGAAVLWVFGAVDSLVRDALAVGLIAGLVLLGWKRLNRKV